MQSVVDPSVLANRAIGHLPSFHRMFPERRIYDLNCPVLLFQFAFVGRLGRDNRIGLAVILRRIY